LTKRKFRTLDALRGIAAIGVLMGHYKFLFRPIEFTGLFSVDLFFAMSGFVIAYSYERRFQDGMVTAEFFLIRLIRFYPLYILGTLLGLLVAAVSFVKGSAPEWSSANILWASISAIFMLPTPLPVTFIGTQDAIIFPLNAVAWSLFLEMAINVIYAATWRYWTKPNLVVWSIFSSILFAISIWYFRGMDTGWSAQNFLGGVTRVLFSFPIGVLIFRLHKFDRNFGLSGFVVALGAATILMINFHWSYPVQAIIAVVALPSVLWLAVRSEPTLIISRVARFFGDISYAVYAIHLPAILLLLRSVQKLGLDPGAFAPLSGLTILTGIFVVCSILDIFDQRIRKYLLGLIHRHKSIFLPRTGP
jgi:peptidoglycan/LPS O-acetylase OafA/YrhL